VHTPFNGDKGEKKMDWFSILLAVTTVVRGFGAGLIYDVAMVGLPVRRKIGAILYAEYAVALFNGPGIRTYGPVSILGALLTLAIMIVALVRGEPAIIIWSTTTALIATVLAFVGTSRALPAVLSLRHANADEAFLSKTLDRFARWHTFSTAWQLVSFIALVVAMVG
jgi:hypothetical protein